MRMNLCKKHEHNFRKMKNQKQILETQWKHGNIPGKLLNINYIQIKVELNLKSCC